MPLDANYQEFVWRCRARGWDAEPTGHDYQTALWLWCLGFRRERRSSASWHVHTLVRYAYPSLMGRKPKYVTLRTYTAFCALEDTYANRNANQK